MDNTEVYEELLQEMQVSSEETETYNQTYETSNILLLFSIGIIIGIMVFNLFSRKWFT